MNVEPEAKRKIHLGLTEQTDRPATVVVTDKGVPQPDNFAKYVAALICPVCP